MDNKQNYFDIMMRLSDIALEAEKASAIQEEIQEGYFADSETTEEGQLLIINHCGHYRLLCFVLGDYIRQIEAATRKLEDAVGDIWKAAPKVTA